MAPAQILARLDDRFRILRGGSRTALPRQQALDSLIAWSYDLLNSQERALFHRLAVFSGGWTLEAAEKVCADSPDEAEQAHRSDVAIEEWEVLELLTSLVDKSLVTFQANEQSGRYRFLESIRHYAQMRRESEADDGAERRHAAYFQRLVSDAEPYLQGPERAAWIDRIEQDHDNVRMVLTQCLMQAEQSGRPVSDRELALCGGMGWFWYLRGYLKEGRSWLEKVLALPGEASESRADALTALGMIALRAGDAAGAEEAHQKALEIRRRASDRRGTAVSLQNLGNVALQAGQTEDARAHYEACIIVWEELGEDEPIARVLNNLGASAFVAGDTTAARRLYLRGLEHLRLAADRGGIPTSLYNLAEVALAEADFPAAEGYLVECIERLERAEDAYVHAHAVHMLGLLCSRTDRDELAVTLWGAAATAFEQIGASLKSDDTQALAAALDSERELLGREVFERLWQRGRDMTLRQAAEAVRAPAGARAGD